MVSGTAGRHLSFRDNPASSGTVGKYVISPLNAIMDEQVCYSEYVINSV